MTHELATLGTYLHRDEAEIACACLASEGIAAIVVADDEGGLSPGFFTDFRIRLVVRSADLPAAREALSVSAE